MFNFFLNIKDVMKSNIDTYNSNSHRTLNNKSPNQVFKDNDDQIARHLNDSVHNQQVYKSVPFWFIAFLVLLVQQMDFLKPFYHIY